MIFALIRMLHPDPKLIAGESKKIGINSKLIAGESKKIGINSKLIAGESKKVEINSKLIAGESKKIEIDPKLIGSHLKPISFESKLVKFVPKLIEVDPKLIKVAAKPIDFESKTRVFIRYRQLSLPAECNFYRHSLTFNASHPVYFRLEPLRGCASAELLRTGRLPRHFPGADRLTDFTLFARPDEKNTDFDRRRRTHHRRRPR